MKDFYSQDKFKITGEKLSEYCHVVDEALDYVLNETESMQLPIVGGITEEICLSKSQVKGLSFDGNYRIDLSSFEPQKALNPKIWPNNRLNSKVRLRLMDISDDFLDFLNIKWAKPKDVILTGSLANYNWSKYSDFDLHILMDFKDIDERRDFVKEYVDSKKNLWNESHDNLKIYGFPVELYVQDINEDFSAGGIYSINKNKWVKEPIKDDIQLAKSSKPEIKAKSIVLMKKIDKLYKTCEKETDAFKVENIGKEAKLLFDKIKGMRRESLKTGGEMSVGNLIFKVLRRTDYIGKLFDIKTKTYDKIKSIE